MPQPGLPPANEVGTPHLTTQDSQEDDQLSGIHVMCSYHQQSLLVSHLGGDSINPSVKDRWPLSVHIPFANSFLPSPEQ